jgi:hypothetical protein
MMTTTTAPPWLRRSDQAVTWARGMLSPHRAVVIDCETTDLPGAISGKVGYSNLRNRTQAEPASLTKSIESEKLSVPTHHVKVEKRLPADARIIRLMQVSSIRRGRCLSRRICGC